MTGGRGRCGTANGRGSIRFRCHARRSRVARTSGGACQALPSTSLHGTRTTPGEAYKLQWLSPLVCTRRGSCLRGDRGRRVWCRQHGRPFTPTTVFAGCWRPPPAASCRLTALAAGATPPTFATSLPCNLRPARTSPAIRGRSMCWKPIPVNPPSSSPPAMAGMPCCGVWTGAAHRSCASPGAGGGERIHLAWRAAPWATIAAAGRIGPAVWRAALDCDVEGAGCYTRGFLPPARV